MKKQLFIGILGILLIIGMIGIAYAESCTIIRPVDNAIIKGTYMFNISFGTTTLNYSHCNITTYSSSTANSSATLIAQNILTSNSLYGSPFINASINGTGITNGFEDAPNYVVGAVCEMEGNGTQTTCTSITGITIDNGIPTAASSLSPATNTIDKDGSVIFSGTVVGANTTACTLRIYVGSNQVNAYTMTHSGDTCSTTRSLNQGSYLWLIDADDGSNNTLTSKLELGINTKEGDYSGVVNEQGQVVIPGQQTTKKSPIYYIIGGIIAAYLIFSKKKIF